jgi:hypothetical protein
LPKRSATARRNIAKQYTETAPSTHRTADGERAGGVSAKVDRSRAQEIPRYKQAIFGSCRFFNTAAIGLLRNATKAAAYESS